MYENAKEGDFIYLDPPYNPASATTYFTGYTTNGFSIKDQKELAEVYRRLDERRCKVMLTNSKTSLVQELYADFAANTTEVDSKRSINCKGSKRICRCSGLYNTGFNSKYCDNRLACIL